MADCVANPEEQIIPDNRSQVMTTTIDIEKIVQTAFVVRDIHTSMATYASKMKIGPWFVMERFTPGEAHYRGEPTNLLISVAFAFRDAAMFELIEQHDDSPSVFREVIEQRGYGLHHIGLTTRTYDALFASHIRAGFECVFSARTTGRLAFFATADLAHMVELLELDPKRRRFFAAIAQAAAAWDGAKPIREVSELLLE